VNKKRKNICERKNKKNNYSTFSFLECSNCVNVLCACITFSCPAVFTELWLEIFFQSPTTFTVFSVFFCQNAELCAVGVPIQKDLDV